MRSQPEPNNLEQEFERYAVLLRAIEQLEDSEMASDILQAFTAGKTVLDGFKLLAEYKADIKDTQKHGEFMRIIGQLSMEIAEIQLKHGAQIERIRELTAEIERLKRPEIELIRENGLYFDPYDKTFPFCPNCYVKSKDHRVLSDQGTSLNWTTYCCPECGWEGKSKRSD